MNTELLRAIVPTRQRFVVMPGMVTDKYTHLSHYVSSSDLIRLHDLKIEECIILKDEDEYDRLSPEVKQSVTNIYPRNGNDYQKKYNDYPVNYIYNGAGGG